MPVQYRKPRSQAPIQFTVNCPFTWCKKVAWQVVQQLSFKNKHEYVIVEGRKIRRTYKLFLLCYVSFHLYTVITLKRSINGLISVIIFKRMMTNISFNITNLQDNYLCTKVSMNKSMTDTQMPAVLTYLCTMCFLLRTSDWSSNVQRRKRPTLPFTRNCPVTSTP